MVRPKGITSHRKGLTLEKEYGEEKARDIKGKLSKNHMGQKSYYQGKKLFREHINNLKKAWIKRKENGFGVAWNKGIKHSESHKKKCLEALKKNPQVGENHYNWKGGITSLNKRLRLSSKYKIWRELVFLRDNFTCQNPNCSFCNNKIGVMLHPHHIQPLTFYFDLVFNVDNGITYCAEFHLKSGLHKGLQMQKES